MTFREIDTTGLKAATVADQMGPELLWAEVARLVIDDRYQRQITGKGRSAIQRIANEWDWRKYQPIIVAPADGGRLAVVDGQHRAHAASVAGIVSLPAMLVPMTPIEQARAFTALNTTAIRLNRAAVFRAQLAAGDPVAVAASEAVAKAGCTLMTSMPSAAHRKIGQIFAHKLIMSMVDCGERDAVVAGLRAIRESEVGQDYEPDCYNGHTRVYDDKVVRPWLTAIASNQRFLSLPLADVFDEIEWDDEYAAAKVRHRQTGTPARTTVIESVTAKLRAALLEAAA